MNEMYKKLSGLRSLSYRRLKRLSKSERKLYSSQIDPEGINLALKYRAITKCSIKESIKWVKANRRGYMDWLIYKGGKRPKVETNQKYVAMELQARGFVPISKYPPKRGFDYLLSKGPVNGINWILPIEAAHDYKRLAEGYPNAYQLQSKYGLENWTGLNIKYSL